MALRDDLNNSIMLWRNSNFWSNELLMQKFDETEDANEAEWAIKQDVFEKKCGVFFTVSDLSIPWLRLDGLPLAPMEW